MSTGVIHFSRISGLFFLLGSVACAPAKEEIVAQYINAKASSIQIGTSHTQNVQSQERGSEVECQGTKFYSKEGEFLVSIEDQSDNIMNVSLSAGGKITSDYSSETKGLYCSFKASWEVNEDGTYLKGTGKITSCDGFACAYSGESISCEDMQKALRESGC